MKNIKITTQNKTIKLNQNQLKITKEKPYRNQKQFQMLIMHNKNRNITKIHNLISLKISINTMKIQIKIKNIIKIKNKKNPLKDKKRKDLLNKIEANLNK